MGAQERLLCTVASTRADHARTTLEQRAGEAVSNTSEYNVATSCVARWEGNTWVVEVTDTKTVLFPPHPSSLTLRSGSIPTRA